LRGAGVAVD
jgi:hypothetical protein